MEYVLICELFFVQQTLFLRYADKSFTNTVTANATLDNDPQISLVVQVGSNTAADDILL
jgi:hypothetical protein